MLKYSYRDLKRLKKLSLQQKQQQNVNNEFHHHHEVKGVSPSSPPPPIIPPTKAYEMEWIVAIAEISIARLDWKVTLHFLVFDRALKAICSLMKKMLFWELMVPFCFYCDINVFLVFLFYADVWMAGLIDGLIDWLNY